MQRGIVLTCLFGLVVYKIKLLKNTPKLKVVFLKEQFYKSKFFLKKKKKNWMVSKGGGDVRRG